MVSWRKRQAKKASETRFGIELQNLILSCLFAVPGVISKKGVLAPMTADLYEPLLKGIEAEGISMTEETL